MHNALQLEVSRFTDHDKLIVTDLFPNQSLLNFAAHSHPSSLGVLQDTSLLSPQTLSRDETDRVILFFLSHANKDGAKESEDAFVISGRRGPKRILKSASPIFGGSTPEDILRELTYSAVWVEKFKVSKEKDFNSILLRREQCDVAAVLCNFDENGRIATYRFIEPEERTAPNGARLSQAEAITGFEYVLAATTLTPAKYSSISLCDNWTHETSGGTPIPIRANLPGDDLSWARNPQYLLEIETTESGESELLVLLSQVGVKQLREIFVCVCYAPPRSRPQAPMDRFSKTALLKDGGTSYIRRATSVSLSAKISIPNRFLIIPSTWETGITGQFEIDCHVKTLGRRAAVKLRRIN